jgi:hypothetical protein
MKKLFLVSSILTLLVRFSYSIDFQFVPAVVIPPPDNLGNHIATTTLNMTGHNIINATTITITGGMIKITSPTAVTSIPAGVERASVIIGFDDMSGNHARAVAIGGKNTRNNFDGGVGIGIGAELNHTHGVGIGRFASSNHTRGIGIGGYAHTNHTHGVGVGHNANLNHSHGVGMGDWARVNHTRGVGIGVGASFNHSHGVGVGDSAHSNNIWGVGIGAGARDNFSAGIGIGREAHSNRSEGVGIGHFAHSNNDFGVGVGAFANFNHARGVGIGGNARTNHSEGIGIGKNAFNNPHRAIGIGSHSQNNLPYGTSIGAFTLSHSTAIALGSFARAEAPYSVVLGARARTTAPRAVAIGAYTINHATGTVSTGDYRLISSTITTIGRVGVGTMTPAHKLDVAGDSRFGIAGTSLTHLQHGTVSVDPPLIGAGASLTFTITISGIAIGDRIILTPPSDLHGDLIFQGASITAVNTLTVRMRNLAGVGVDDIARTWTFIKIRP